MKSAAWAAAVLALAGQSPREGPPPQERRLTVFAAASLAAAFTEIGDSLEGRTPGLRVRFNFAGSQQLAAQLAAGADADVFASADSRWMRQAVSQGLAAGAAVVFARNHLVVVVPARNPGRIERIEDLARRGVVLVLADSAVPAGAYAREALIRFGRLPGQHAQFARDALANVASNEENVSAVLAKVQLGEADAGIVYRSDVTTAAAAKVLVLPFPGAADVIAEYPLVALARAADPAAAQGFIGYVLGAAGQRILAAHGLLPASRP